MVMQGCKLRGFTRSAYRREGSVSEEEEEEEEEGRGSSRANSIEVPL